MGVCCSVPSIANRCDPSDPTFPDCATAVRTRLPPLHQGSRSRAPYPHQDERTCNDRSCNNNSETRCGFVGLCGLRSSATSTEQRRHLLSSMRAFCEERRESDTGLLESVLVDSGFNPLIFRSIRAVLQSQP